MSLVFVDEMFISQIKRKIKDGMERWDDVGFELQRKADKCMNLGPWSVTYHESPAKSQNPHDYFSEGPYWWPDPANPEGAYIRRDGESNPDVFRHHRDGIEQLAQTVLLLSLAGYYLDNRAYTERAVKLLSTWFLDNGTRMNPHLEYGQAIRGICDGRAIGIIDTKELVTVIHACGFIALNDNYKHEITQLKNWFNDYLTWLNTSEKGLEEKHYFNNHANWWNTQAAAFAAFVGNESLLAECFERFKTVIIPDQMDVDGSFPDEITRTISFTYSLFSLEACTLLCEIAHYQGLDLWHYHTADNKGMNKAVTFMLPYVENPFLWPHQQIAGKLPSDNISLQLGGLRLGIEECAKINKLRGTDYYLIRNTSHIGPLVLLPGFAFS